MKHSTTPLWHIVTSKSRTGSAPPSIAIRIGAVTRAFWHSSVRLAAILAVHHIACNSTLPDDEVRSRCRCAMHDPSITNRSTASLVSVSDRCSCCNDPSTVSCDEEPKPASRATICSSVKYTSPCAAASPSTTRRRLADSTRSRASFRNNLAVRNKNQTRKRPPYKRTQRPVAAVREAPLAQPRRGF